LRYDLVALGAVMSLFAKAAAGVVIFAAGCTSNMLEAAVEIVAGFVLELLAAIGAILGAPLGSLVE
jgi:hypothetical protein